MVTAMNMGMAMDATRARQAADGVGERSRSMTQKWALRGGLALLAIASGYVSLSHTLATVIASSSPERAYSISRQDGRIGADYAQKLLIDAGGKTDPQIERIARTALENEPTAVGALTVLAISEAQRNPALAQQLLAKSDAMSRRHLGTRFLLIENAVVREDITDALRHYDIALRTSRAASDPLFSVLGSAIDDPGIVSPLARLLASAPPWADSFLRYIVSSKAQQSAVTSFFKALVDQRAAIPEDVEAGIINRLATHGAVDQAWFFYRALRQGSNLTRSRDPNFTLSSAYPTVFDWTPIMDSAGITASIQPTAEGGIFDFAAPSTVGGIVLQQMQRLPPGRYRLNGDADGMDQWGSARPYWALVCTDARELGRVEMPAQAQSGQFAGEINVDRGCPAQLLRLIVRPTSAVSGISGQIRRVSLQRVGASS